MELFPSYNHLFINWKYVFSDGKNNTCRGRICKHCHVANTIFLNAWSCVGCRNKLTILTLYIPDYYYNTKVMVAKIMVGEVPIMSFCISILSLIISGLPSEIYGYRIFLISSDIYISLIFECREYVFVNCKTGTMCMLMT